ncbi:MAG: transketolase [Clostridia bacterium]|nr:transketolase [Clostridia bacterium]
MDQQLKAKLGEFARQVRIGIIESTFQAKSGHPGGSLSIADIFSYLYNVEMNIDPKDPKMENRDRFVLSKGHTAPALYSTLANRGFFPVEDLKTLRKTDSYLQGHPDMKHIPGVDMSSGSLGQGVAVANGLALGAKLKGADYRVYAIMGDGESEEGECWEAAMFAAHYKLDNLCVILDSNGLQIDGPIADVIGPAPHDEKYRAFGWNVIDADAHDFDSLEKAFAAARACKGKPSIIIAHSLKGKGVSFMEGSVGWHGKAPNEDEYKQALAELGVNA